MSVRFGCSGVEGGYDHIRRREILSIAVRQCCVASIERLGKNFAEAHRAGENLVFATQHSATQVFDGLGKRRTILQQVNEKIGVPEDVRHALVYFSRGSSPYQ